MNVSHIIIISSKHSLRANFEHHTIIKTRLHLSFLSPSLTDSFLCSLFQPDTSSNCLHSSQSLPHLLSHSLSGFHCHHSIQTILLRWPITSVSPNLSHFSVLIFSVAVDHSLSLNKIFFSWFPRHYIFSAFLLLGWLFLSCFLFFQTFFVTNELWL